jgi:hypothetical protein
VLHGNSDVTPILIPHIASSLVDVLLAAGMKATPEQIRDDVMATFGEKFYIIARLALGLNWAIGKDVTSADLETFVVIGKTVSSMYFARPISACSGSSSCQKRVNRHGNALRF